MIRGRETISNFFYRNPRLVILTVAVILVAGLSSYMLLPRMEDPILSERVAVINTVYPGANAERVEALVTEVIEEELREIDEISDLRSASRSGVSTITVELADWVTTESDEVWSRVRDKLGDVQPDLPTAALTPNFRRMNMKAFAMIVAIAWDKESPPNYAILRRQAERLEDVLLGVSGTEKVETFGDPDEEFVAEVDGNKLALLGLTVSDIASQLRATDSKISAGLIRSAQNDVLMEVDAELTSQARIGRTPVKVGTQGQVVRLDDIATIAKGVVEPASSLAIVGGKSAVALGVLVHDDRRVDVWSREVDRVLAAQAEEMPLGVEIVTVFRQNDYVETRLLGLLGNLVLGAAGVMVVIFVLMGWRSAMIVGVALPLSAMMVLTGMNWLGIPIHQMSITGLIIALGLLIDNAIVMVDETGAALKEGRAPGEAVAETVGHLFIPLLGSTITTALAFAPIALMDGPAGEFVGSIAVSVIMAIFSSLFLAMTLVPALTAWGLGEYSAQARWWSIGVSSRPFIALYDSILRVILRRPMIGVAIGILLPVLGFTVASQLPEQFFPPADRNQFQIELELPPQSSLANTLQTVNDIRDRVLQEPNVVSVDWFVGESAPTFYYNVIPRRENTPSYAQALVQLDKLEGSRETIHKLQTELDQEFPQTRVLVRQLEQGPPFDAPVEVRLFGPDLDRLRELGDELRGRLASIPNVVHTRADLSESLPKLAIQVDEEAARLAGLDHTSIAMQLQTALEGQQGGAVLEATEELPVRVRLPNVDRSNVSRISSINLQSTQVRTASALGSIQNTTNIPLTAVAEITFQPESAAIPHRAGRRVNEVQAFTKAGVLPATVLAALQASLDEKPLDLQPGYEFVYGGEAAERDDAVGSLLASVGVLAVLMVATLVLSFGSFRLAGLIGAIATLSLGLGMGALWLFGYPFGFMAIIGSMGLMGVAINDAIVVLAGIQAHPHAKEGDQDAIRGVVMQTTRHIIATSLTTMAGFAPLVMSGGEFWPPMAVAISGGVAGATILALLFVPSAYLLLVCRHKCPVVERLDGVAVKDSETPSSELEEPQSLASSEVEPRADAVAIVARK